MLDLSGKTMSSLLSSMLLRITEQVNKRDGSLIKTALSAAAWAIEGIYIELINIQKQAYGTTATGEYLDLKAEERGVTRHPATQEVCELFCNLSTLELGFQLADSSGYTWTVTSGVISGPDDEGLYKYQITCATAGAIAEPTGDLRSLSFLSGLVTAKFGDVLSPGENQETDAALRQRYEESLVEIAFAGNVAAYREQILAMEYPIGETVATVGALQVFSTTDIDGTIKGGNVKIYITNSSYGVASDALVSAVQKAICPMYNGVAVGDGNGFAPIGAAVHICTATSTPVLEIDVKLLLVQSTLDTVEGTIKSRIMSYVSSQIRTWGVQVKTPGDVASITIREAFIYAAALIEGVSDVLSVKIKKDNVYFPGQASWNTDRAEMEWIVENDVVINITT
jgi:uncharacterized phage protein gp47/JayE